MKTLKISIYAATKKSNEMMAHTYADVSDLMKDFDYKPDTHLKEGVSAFVSWYKDFYKV